MPPARGCHVECPGGQHCARCARHGRICTEYRAANELVIQDETQKAAERSRRYGRARSPRGSPSRRPTADEGFSSSVIRPSEPDLGHAWLLSNLSRSKRSVELGRLPWLRESLPRHLQPPAQDVAISRFFAHYVVNPRSYNGDDGHLGDLPLLYSRSEHDSILRLAVDACSLASFANVAQAEVFVVAARVKYGQVLHALQTATANSQLAARDETLMAILVLEYHSLVADDQPELFGPHARAIAPILRLRGSSQFHTSIGWNMFRPAYMRLQYLELLYEEEPTVQSFVWMHELAEEHPEVQIHASASRISRACSEVSTLLKAAEPSAAAVHAAVKQLHECEVACQDWLQTAPWQWKPKHKAAASDAAESPQAFIYYRDIWVAIAHYYHRSFRIQLHETRVRALHFSGDASGDVLAFEKAGRELIEENMLSVPFLLGQVDPCGNIVKDWLPLELGLFHAAVALKMIVRSPLAAEEQKERAREVMEAVLRMARRESTGI